jgi:hypothetical protein
MTPYQTNKFRTENPCVGGSIPPHTTETSTEMLGLFVLTIYRPLFYFPVRASESLMQEVVLFSKISGEMKRVAEYAGFTWLVIFNQSTNR